MKFILLFFLFITNHLSAQSYVLPGGREYMDTTTNSNTSCRDYGVYYYSVGGKYPASSSTTLSDVKTFLKHKHTGDKSSGYITFRFMIDCNGNRLKRTQVLQTDNSYLSYHFNKKLVSNLYKFLNIMRNWKVAKNPKGDIYPYTTFITYKIEHGKVINIIP